MFFFQANHGKEKSWIPKLGNTHPNTDTGNFSCTTISSASSGSGIRVVKEEKSLEDSAFKGINFDEKLEASDTWSSLGSYLAFKRATFLCSRIRCTSHLFAILQISYPDLPFFSKFPFTDFQVKFHIFWGGHKILRNLPLTFDCIYCGQTLGEDFAKFGSMIKMPAE